ncbi:Na+/H+ antiporter, NhaC-like, C-terminal [Acididesulfobacillus acetoxydans]|uniref:Na+/H+ antiporter NhaC-like protein n=1 Tax=Acididesulfobacillus acetoxydans TaxID=1561005 RepID=A0A8S0WH42_9FIRM|nr:Na+/H+ antiporter NhaC family protein [Acididesulfobacillus acetoxydans]CAA7602422.1 Na+/H+ antiporter, NhaC-like, C-terminal [Acididesulfobacillus acetoxydans]CEJ08343.1 Na+/H+ antiporter NhaC-like protein [Acididesulfobacillus acetoxydans]
MYGTFWSLVPFLVVIPLALLTRQVLPGLLAGLLVGGYMLNSTPLGGIDTSLQYIMKELVLPDNARLILFMYGFGAFVGLVRITGGVSGFAEFLETRIRTARGAFVITWLSSLVTFMAPDFRIITVGPVMKQIFSRLNVSAEKVALVVDATSTPLCAIMPLGTVFIGYILGLLGTVGRHQGIAASPYQMFLLSIPFNFFSLGMLAFSLFYSFGRSAKAREGERLTSSAYLRALGAAKLVHAETSQELALPLGGRKGGRAEGKGRPTKSERGGKRADRKQTEAYPDPVELVAQKVPPNALNLLVPLALLLGFTLFFTWWDGHLRAPGVLAAFIRADAAKAMLEALLTTLIFSFVWYALQKHSINRILFGFLQGGNEMMAVNLLLVLVWAVSAVSTRLGFAAYTEQTVGHWVPAAFVTPAFFVIGCLLSYVIGSSFGTWGILLPLGFSLAAAAHVSLPLMAGAVLASGTFGGFASPLSDNTVAMATVMKIPVIDYANKKLRYGLMVAAACALLYGLAGWLMR